MRTDRSGSSAIVIILYMKPVSFVRTSPRALGEAKEEYGYENPLSLDELVVEHPSATFFVRVGEDIDQGGAELLGIGPGDVLTVDRAAIPRLGSLVLCVVDGEFAVWRYTEHDGVRHLVSGSGESIDLADSDRATLWGVVIALTRKV